MIQHAALFLQTRAFTHTSTRRIGVESGVDRRARAPPFAIASRPMNLDGIRVLLVEDNPGDARLFTELLRDAGADRLKMVHVDRLSAAIDHLNNDSFDAMLLDLSLPDADGLDTLVRAHAHAPKIPIVVLTGHDDEALPVRAVRLGAQDYLVKDASTANSWCGPSATLPNAAGRLRLSNAARNTTAHLSSTRST